MFEKGKKLFRPSGIDNLYMNYCQPIIKEVLSFSEPTSMNGEMHSKVKYSYSVANFEDWAKNPQVVTAFPGVKHDFESINQPKEGVTDVLLTSEGWTTWEMWSSKGGSNTIGDRSNPPPISH
ncbi:hypothetical protein [Altericista sp. CCNU0014]|uniref:hypothetical protein n=1 Tax=Altericista sp. CCNU0014 TaxID=3082949 RepID=UPI0038516E75